MKLSSSLILSSPIRPSRRSFPQTCWPQHSPWVPLKNDKKTGGEPQAAIIVATVLVCAWALAKLFLFLDTLAPTPGFERRIWGFPQPPCSDFYIHQRIVCSFPKKLAASTCIMSWQFVNGSRDPLHVLARSGKYALPVSDLKVDATPMYWYWYCDCDPFYEPRTSVSLIGSR